MGKINALLTASGFDLLNDGLKTMWVPDVPSIAQCKAYGKEIVTALG